MPTDAEKLEDIKTVLNTAWGAAQLLPKGSGYEVGLIMAQTIDSVEKIVGIERKRS